jgi:DNA-binding CsgD family transcriptional regulator
VLGLVGGSTAAATDNDPVEDVPEAATDPGATAAIRPEIIGRADELAAVHRLFARGTTACAGLVFEGDAGIGKTTIVDAAIAAAAAMGFRVLRARPAESERNLTLATLTDIFGSVDASELSALPSPQRRVLEAALLRADAEGIATDPRALSIATTALLRSLARPGAPVLIGVDDAQWLDDSCRSVLAYAVRRLADRPLAVLLALRRESEAATRTDDLLAALPAATSERLLVGPMPLASLHRLIRERLVRSLSRVALVRIEEASGGNPFYALELARTVATDAAGIAVSEAVPVPVTLGGVVAGRIAALPSATRRALLLVAIALEPTVATLVRADPRALKRLTPAIAQGIVAVRADSVRFSHPLLAQAVIDSVAAAEVREAHARLARASMRVEAQARHAGHAAAAPDEAVANDLERSAATARALGATLDAASLYEQASRLTPGGMPDWAVRRARLAAECLFIDISDVVEADAILDRALARAVPGRERAETLSLRAIIRYYHGRIPEAIDLARQASVEPDVPPIGRARVLVRLAFLLAQQDVEEALRILRRAIGLLDGMDAEHEAPDLVANALLLRASLRFGLVLRVDSTDVERGERLISAGGCEWEHDNAAGLLFGLARHTDELDRAIAMTEELIRSKSGAGGDDPFNLVQLSGLLCLRGRLSDARHVADAAAEAYDREGSHLVPSWRLRGLALVAAHDGRTDVARRFATEGLELALADGNLVQATFHHHILGFVALLLGEPTAAAEHLTAAAELARRTGNRHPGRFKLDGDRVEAALALGRLDEAAAIVAQLERAVRVVPTPWVHVVSARCRGLLEAARDNLDAALGALDRAVRAQHALPMPFEAGRTLLAKGSIHRRRKEKRLADETLRSALAVFETIGAPVWADRARAELARVGRRPTAPSLLTETERQVAELAARGMRTPRIAERVFLSPKTVGNVLGRVYQKLGIHSRAELGALMGSQHVPSSEEGAADRSG